MTPEIQQIISIAASAVSIILGIFAIGLSVCFFLQAKDAEKEMSKTLEKINVQTDVLQKIMGKQLDKLTKSLTERTPAAETIEKALSSILDHKNSIVNELKDTFTNQQIQELGNEAISGYIGIYYYCVKLNLISQILLGELKGDQLESTVRDIIDESYGDTLFMQNIFTQVIPATIQANRLKHLYDYAENNKTSVQRSSAID